MKLWYLGSHDTVHRIADKFGVSELTVLKMRDKIVYGTLQNLMQKRIKWPDQNQQNEISNYFERKNGFPGIIGCLDGTQVPIRAPKVSVCFLRQLEGITESSITRLCRENMTFTHIFVGFPGSCHDARILKNSDLWETGLSPGGQEHIAADVAYYIQRQLLTLYMDNGYLTSNEKTTTVFYLQIE